jgi:hypothetical protein
VYAPAPRLVSASLPPWFPPLFYLLLAALFLWRSTFAGETFLPARMLGHVAPWTATVKPEELPPWNPLRWDGIAQFYPWRQFAAQTVRSGVVPLWNPYQFCGTPFVANSQSAVFYPGNLLFYLLPTAQAFNFSALLHLTLCGWFTFLLLRRLRCADLAALLGGVVYAYSAWQVAWLQLPTFLTTSCWFPLLLHAGCRVWGAGCSRSLSEENSHERVEGLHRLTAQRVLPTPYTLHPTPCIGLVVGMILLAGHLQIAFYGMLAGTLWAACLLALSWRRDGIHAARRGLAGCFGGLVLGVMLAAPQLLPTFELSRVSHRVGKPTAAGYQAYTEYALQPENLAMLTLPAFFGNDYDPNNPYWGFYIKHAADGSSATVRHNAAETAVYVGVVPLLLGALALLRSRSKERGLSGEGEREVRRWDKRALFFGGLAAFALLMALGTPLNALFYYGVPGFGQSGSPARALVLWALAWAALAGIGLDSLLRRPPTLREIAGSVGAVAVVLAVGLGMAALVLAQPPKDVPAFGEVMGRIGLDWIRLAIAVLGGAALLFLARRTETHGNGEMGKRGKENGSNHFLLSSSPPFLILLVVAELFWAGISINPTAPPNAVYPETPGLTLVRQRVGHERIFPINQRWSLYKSPPAVLPPNAATVYGLRDVQGYDSLLTGQYKAFANQFARPAAMGRLDASPPEVGNMVFFQDANAPLVPATAAVFALTPSPSTPAFLPGAAPPGAPLYDADNEMAVYALSRALPRAFLVPSSQDAARPIPPRAWKEDAATRVTLNVSAPGPMTLNLADQFYPGWKAYIDGQSVTITRRADVSVFRAVSVPPGDHVVSFRYEPAGFRIGLYLACLACFLISLCLAFSRRPAA